MTDHLLYNLMINQQQQQLTPWSWVLLDQLTLTQAARKFPAFMEPKGSLLCSQQPVISPYPEPDESNIHPTCFPKIHYPSIYAYVFQVVRSHSAITLWTITIMMTASTTQDDWLCNRGQRFNEWQDTISLFATTVSRLTPRPIKPPAQ